MIKLTSLVISLFTCSGFLSAQGFLPPAKGKSVVYFVRPGNYQKDISTLVFDGDRFVADFPGTQYYRYECSPGEHLFWASGENTDFVVADLKPDASYVIYIEALAGTMMPKVRVSPMPAAHKKFHMAKWLITHKPSITEEAGVLEAENQRMSAFMIRSTAAMRQSPEFSSAGKKLSPDMNLPVEKYQ